MYEAIEHWKQYQQEKEERAMQMTPFLIKLVKETFRLNIPTVIFWDPNYWENRDSVKNLFNELKRVKIFHDSPESASKHINEIWDNVEGWWGSSEVTYVINEFNQSINRNNENLVSDLIKILK